MTDKFHINNMGNPGKCSATKGGCPFGEESDHFDSADAARASFENAKTKQLFAPLKAKISAGSTKPTRPLSELNRLAKTSNDPEILTEAAENGSDRTFGNLAANAYATSENLDTAFARTSDRATKLKLQAHENFPLGSLDEDGLVQLHRKSTVVFGHKMRSDDITDAQAKIVIRQFAYDGANRILANPNNKITTPTLVRLAEADIGNLRVAVSKNPRYPVLDRVEHLNDRQLEEVCGHTVDAEVIRKIYNSSTNDENRSKIEDRIVANQNTPTDVLDKIGERDNSKTLRQDYLFYHNNSSPELKAKIKSLDPIRFG